MIYYKAFQFYLHNWYVVVIMRSDELATRNWIFLGPIQILE